MHILLIPSWYPTAENPFNGNFIRRHAEILAEKHQVTILTFSSENIPQTETEMQQNGNLKSLHIRYPKKNTKAGQFFSLRKAFKQAVKEIRSIELIHVHVMLDRGILGIWAKKHFQKPLVVTEHGSYLFRENYQKLSTGQKMVIIQTLKQAAAVSCVSQALEAEIRYLFPRVKTALTPNVVDRNLFVPAEKSGGNTMRFLHISTLEPVKNVPEMIRAFELLNEKYPDFELEIICETPNKEVSRQISVSPVGGKITIHGPLPIEQVATAMQQADALVMLSSYETFSCVIAEAWASGLPVISTPVGIAADMPGYAGMLVPETSAQALAVILEKFLRTKNTFDPENLRTLTENYSPEAVSASFEQFYASVLKR